MNKQRLDVVLVERGLVDSRSKAQSLIMARRVLVNGQFVDKAGANVAADDEVSIAELEHPWQLPLGISDYPMMSASISGKRGPWRTSFSAQQGLHSL